MESLEIPQETLLAVCIRYGLYVGAVFQMFCLGAVIFFMPKNQPKGSKFGALWNFLRGENDIDNASSQSSPQETPKRPIQRSRKQERKKRR